MNEILLNCNSNQQFIESIIKQYVNVSRTTLIILNRKNEQGKKNHNEKICV